MDHARTRVSTRILAIGLIAFVALQMAVKVVGLSQGEFYPAIAFPGFARLPEGSAEEAEEVRIRKVVLHTRSESIELTADETFPEPYNSFYLPMLDSLSAAGPTDSLRDWASDVWQRRTGDETCVVRLEVVEVTLVDDYRNTLNDVAFSPCTQAAGATDGGQ